MKINGNLIITIGDLFKVNGAVSMSAKKHKQIHHVSIYTYFVCVVAFYVSVGIEFISNSSF